MYLVQSCTGNRDRRLRSPYLLTHELRPSLRSPTVRAAAALCDGHNGRRAQSADSREGHPRRKSGTNPNGWAGVDGAFRFLPDGRTERALAVIEVQGDRGVVVSPAPGNFSSQVTN